jgi:C4-type Zn-finger protein
MDEDDEPQTCPHCRDDLVLRVLSRAYSEELGVGFVKFQFECHTCGYRTDSMEEEM